MKNAIILTNNLYLLGRNKYSNLHFDLFGNRIAEKVGSIRQAYKTVIYLIDYALLDESKGEQVFEYLAKTSESTGFYPREGLIIIGGGRDVQQYESLRENTLIMSRVQLEQFLPLLNTLLKPARFFELSELLDSFNSRIEFIHTSDSETVTNIPDIIDRELTNKNLITSDVKILIFHSTELKRRHQHILFDTIKYINYHSDIEFYRIKGIDFKGTTIVCFPNKNRKLKIFDSTKFLLQESYRYFDFIDKSDDATIIISKDQSDYTLSGKSEWSLETTNAKIPRCFLPNYLDLVEMLFSPQHIISMISIYDITDVTEGALSEYLKLDLNNDININTIKNKIANLYSGTNAIVFFSKYSLLNVNELRKISKRVNGRICVFSPDKSYIDIDNYAEIFIFTNEGSIGIHNAK